MKLTENFVKSPDYKNYNWRQYENPILKGDYKNESVHGEIKTYRLTPKEMEEYLKKFENKNALEVPRV